MHNTLNMYNFAVRINEMQSSLCQNINQPLRVTIQGVAGCYHDAAAHNYFDGRDIETIECASFPEMFDRLAADASLLGIIAIENTIAGSLLQNHELIRASNMRIVGEYKMRISHSLAALSGQTIDQITEVHSHPMALRQCEQYIHRHPHLRMVENFDTAGSAKEIAELSLTGHAAICGDYAARLYGLNIIESGIETNKRNFTRFLIIADPLLSPDISPKESAIDKSSIVFTLPHTTGALSKVLTILSFYDINLTKIQSMPILGREWEYRFYIDLVFDSYHRYRQAVSAVTPLTNDLRILGEYTYCKNEV